MKKAFIAAAFALLLSLVMLMPVVAKETTSETLHPVPEVGEALELLPEDAAENLPDGGDPAEILGNADGEYLLTLSLSLFGKAFSSAIKMFFRFFAIIIIGATASVLSRTFIGKNAQICVWLTVLCTAYEAYAVIFALFSSVVSHIGQICKFMTGMSAVLTGVYVAGGNASTAAVSGTITAVLLSVVGRLCSGYMIPILQISFASTLAATVSPSVNLRGMSELLRKIYISVTVFVSALFSILLEFQTSIAAAQDSVAVRGIKFAAANSIPIIGSAVSESAKTLSASVRLIKSTTGGIGILAVIVCAFIPLAELFASKISLSLAGQTAALLGAEANKTLLADIGKLINFLIAAVVIFDMAFIFVFSVYMRCGVAVSG